MNRSEVRGTGNALAYLTCCTLATVCDLACKKSKSKSEFARQIAMAQRAIDWMIEFDVDFSSTRAREVAESFGGSVAAWAAQWETQA